MLKRASGSLALALCLSSRLLAHDVPTVQLGISLQPDSTWRMDVVLDLPHLPVVSTETEAAGSEPIPGLTPALAKRYEPFIRSFLSRSVLSFDGRRVLPRTVEVLAESDADTSPHLRLTGPAPQGARDFTFSSGIGTAVWIVHPRLPLGANAEPQFLHGKETSRPIPLGLVEVPQTRGEVLRRFIGLGFTHILPDGTDHILFVLGIFLLSVHLKPMLIQVTAFTVAHTITLALTMYGVVSLSPSIVEPLIALSIVYVAVENILTDRLTAWRPVVVFCFGLLHGMGFAGVLREVGLPRDRFLTALFSFNLGVECGQLTVILAAFLVLGLPFRGKPWYRKRIVIPASVTIAVVGLFWFVQRAFF